MSEPIVARVRIVDTFLSAPPDGGNPESIHRAALRLTAEKLGLSLELVESVITDWHHAEAARVAVDRLASAG